MIFDTVNEAVDFVIQHLERHPKCIAEILIFKLPSITPSYFPHFDSEKNKAEKWIGQLVASFATVR